MMESRDHHEYNIDYILDHYVGGSGLWQYQQLLVIILAGLVGNIPYYLHLFAAFVPEHRCRVSNCEERNHESYKVDWSSFALPEAQQSDLLLKEAHAHSQCEVYDAMPNSSCTASSFKNASLRCHEYVYDDSIFEETLSTRLNLVCSNEHKRKLLDTTLMIGFMLGCLLGGPLGDRMGRRWSICLALLFLSPAVAVGGVLASFQAYTASRLVTYFFTCLVWINTHTLSLEIYGKDVRMKSNMVLALSFSLDHLVLALIVYFQRHWKYMHLWSAATMALISPVVFMFLTDSVRWMCENGKAEKAEEVLFKMARMNKRTLAESEMGDIKHIVRTIDSKSKSQREQQPSFQDLFRPRYLLLTLANFAAWITAVVSYYVFAFNTTDLAGDIFVNFCLSFILEIFSALYVLLLVDRIGRRASMVLGFILLAMCYLAMSVVPKSSSSTILALFNLGKVMSLSVANVAWLFTAELYPTNLRIQAMSMCSMVSRVAGMLAPFVSNLSSVWPPLPFLLMGVASLLSAGLALCLPEARGQDLPGMAVEVSLDDGDELSTITRKNGHPVSQEKL